MAKASEKLLPSSALSASSTTDQLGQYVFEEIQLGKEPPPLRIAHARILVDDIDFDEDNPRLRYQMSVKGITDEPSNERRQAAISALLFETDDTKYLERDIAENGLLDPIYVKRVGDRYTVVEGNRRTSCFKSLHAKLRSEP